MPELFTGVAIFLMLNLLAGLIRIRRGPTPADRLLAAQLLGTTSTALLLLLAMSLDQPALVDAALVFALLSAVTLVTFISRLWHIAGDPPPAATREEPHVRT